jgi:phosphoribosyl 1,2-cyclic phosphodiesterase
MPDPPEHHEHGSQTTVRRRNGAVELTFLGTRGEIKHRSRLHRRHSALLVQHNEARIMIDCGADWLHRVGTVAPTAILLTHAHSDHAAGLVQGAPCPVYATEPTLKLLRGYPIADRRKMPLRRSVKIGGLNFTAFPVQHSIRAPAVGYRVRADSASFFYLPDVARLPDPIKTLGGIDVYIGDGATIRRSMVRKKRGTFIGHAPMVTQLGWCELAGIHYAVFTHCGSAILREDRCRIDAVVREIGCDHGIETRLASDGDRLILMAVDHGTRRYWVPRSARRS